jgi:hypothetical protein
MQRLRVPGLRYALQEKHEVEVVLGKQNLQGQGVLDTQVHRLREQRINLSGVV